MIIGLYVLQNGWLVLILYYISILCLMLYYKEMRHWIYLRNGWDAKKGIIAIFFGFAGGIVLYVLEPIVGFGVDLYTNLMNVKLSGFSW